MIPVFRVLTLMGVVAFLVLDSARAELSFVCPHF